ncbi:MAG: L,D-transpeptidase [Thermoleophilia bacterium]|nr:L,D-transpeptidase [Thermoleophilia bacterium]
MRRPRRPAAWTAAVALTVLAVPAAGHAVQEPPAGAAATPDALGRPTKAISWVGRLVAPVTARRAPRMNGRAMTVLQPVAPLGGGATVLQITARASDGAGRVWVRVRLPIRPNGSQGWVPVDVLRLNVTRLRIRIDLSDRRLTLYRNNRRVMRVKVAVGTPENPTPQGHFAVAELIRTRTRGAFLGPIVFPLMAFSETLNEYAGGNGRVAMHGTNAPELLGTRASHGCIRIRNSDVVRMARIVRPGTPVDIVP